MHILTLGLNHETAPIEIRERAAVTADHLEEALHDLIARPGIGEAALLSTCNRTEIYCRQDNQDAGQLKKWISQYHDWPEDDVSKYLYVHPNRDAVRHAYRVAAGLDSMVLGESQILGQMKSAFAIAHKIGTTGKILNRLFQSSFSVAKNIRTNTGVGTSAVSVAYAAVLLARQIFDSLEDQSVMLIGAGETIELVGKHLVEKGVKNILVANRTIERGERLANELNGRAIALDELAEDLPHCDILISSTASTLPLIGKGLVETSLKARKNKPMFMVDLAVPRDIEEQVNELQNVFLYTVDDLNQIIETNLASRREAASEAQEIVESQSDEFMEWLGSLNSVPTIRALRDHVDQLTEVELEKAFRLIAKGENPEVVIEQFAYALGNKIMHRPSKALSDGEDSSLATTVQEIFRLNLPNADK
ncbi:MAG: glutamyl-tRNA reductase [Proteobacteria bacterium]|jgi:glutamyl-tRNA reductase|nr:glutamyl-tRNA reductase [Pseudomonadota bacterium]